jgi:hypothetical protein
VDISLPVYVIWHIWKEQGQPIFQQVLMPPMVVVGLIKGDLELLLIDKGSPLIVV